MKKAYRNILIISVCLMLSLFIHDAIYDDPDRPYTISEIISDLLLAGTLYTGLFFGVMAGVYYLVDKIPGKK